ncbi:unnamed protein product [Aphanomyces euteiches]
MSEAEEEQAKHKEGERILAQIKSEAFVFVLAIEGQTWSSEQIAQQIDKLGSV